MVPLFVWVLLTRCWLRMAITWGRGRLRAVGSHTKTQAYREGFLLYFTSFLQHLELDTLLRFLASLGQGWGCSGGAVLTNESGQRHVECGSEGREEGRSKS